MGLAAGCGHPGRWSRGPAGPVFPVAVAVRRSVVADRGAGVPSKAEMDTVEPGFATETVSCAEPLTRGLGCAMVVAAAGASVEPGLPLGGHGKILIESAVSGRGNRLAAGTAFTNGDANRKRATNLPGGSENKSILIRGSCVRKP